MLNNVIAVCLRNRLLVVAVTIVLALYGGYQSLQLPVDVFPDLNRPTVNGGRKSQRLGGDGAT